MLQGKYLSNSELLSPRPAPNLGLKSGSVLENLGAQPTKTKEGITQNSAQESPIAANETRSNPDRSANNSAPAPK